jgi:hypothetical protein
MIMPFRFSRTLPFATRRHLTVAPNSSTAQSPGLENGSDASETEPLAIAHNVAPRPLAASEILPPRIAANSLPAMPPGPASIVAATQVDPAKLTAEREIHREAIRRIGSAVGNPFTYPSESTTEAEASMKSYVKGVADDVERFVEKHLTFRQDLCEAFGMAKENSVEAILSHAKKLVAAAANSREAGSHDGGVAANQAGMRAKVSERVQTLTASGLSYDAAWALVKNLPEFRDYFAGKKPARTVEISESANNRQHAVACAVREFQDAHPGADYDIAFNAVRSSPQHAHLFAAMQQPQHLRK